MRHDLQKAGEMHSKVSAGMLKVIYSSVISAEENNVKRYCVMGLCNTLYVAIKKSGILISKGKKIVSA